MQSKKLQIIQKLNSGDLSSSDNLEGSITLTNVSDLFLNNITLSLSFKNSCIIEQSIVRERGALCFGSSAQPLIIGNLAPNESASFYYKLKAKDSDNKMDVLDTIKITYIEENSNLVTEVLSDPTKEG